MVFLIRFRAYYIRRALVRVRLGAGVTECNKKSRYNRNGPTDLATGDSWPGEEALKVTPKAVPRPYLITRERVIKNYFVKHDKLSIRPILNSPRRSINILFLHNRFSFK